MFELIPSRYMRDYFTTIGFEFTDFQKATIIWNTPERTRQEILDALLELLEQTADEVLKQQLRERLEFEEKVFVAFTDNSRSNYVYVVKEEKDGYDCGYFQEYDRAVKYAVRYFEEEAITCSIKKQLIVKGEEEELVRCPWKTRGNEEELTAYCGDAVAEVRLNERGEVLSVWSYELTKEEEAEVDSFQNGRFEDAFIKMPFDMPMGSFVKRYDREDYYVLAMGKADWEEALQHIEDRKLSVDYIDDCITTYELLEDGRWSHEHRNPLYLEVVRALPDTLGNEKKQAMEAFREYLLHGREQNGVYAEAVLSTARQYAALCREKLLVEEAKVPEDIFC